MRKFTIFALLFIAALIGFFAYTFFHYEKPKQEEIRVEYHNVSVSASEAQSGKRIIANFSIFHGGTPYRGQTLRDSYSVLRIPTNGSFEVLTTAHGYYAVYEVPQINYIYPQNVRIDSILDPIGNFTIHAAGRLGFDDNLSLRLNVQGLIKSLKVCMRWSNNIVSAQIVNLVREDPPHRLQNKVDKCYRIQGRLRNSNDTVLNLRYSLFNPLTPDDEIKLTFLYGDILPSSQKQEVFEDEKGKAVGRDDLIVVLKP